MRLARAIKHRGFTTGAKRLARLAGALYLLVVVLGGIAQLVARAGIHRPAGAHATAQHLDAQPGSVQVSMAADIAMATLFVRVGVTLYLLSGTSTGTYQRRWSSSRPWAPA